MNWKGEGLDALFRSVSSLPELKDQVIQRLREALDPTRVDVSALGREAYARDLSTLGHLA